MKALELIDRSLIEVEEVIADIENVLKTAPSGNLRLRKQGKTLAYYKREKGETAGKYLGKGSEKIIRTLEKKAYYRELLDAAKAEEEALKRAKDVLEKMPDYRSVFLNIAPEKRHLINPYEYLPKEKGDEVIRIFNKKYVPEELKLITLNGEHVRSKSELIIADRLKAASVPYFYEDPLILVDEEKLEHLYWHPDFRVQNIRNGKQYYWEHFGLLDNAEYRLTCQNKLETYARCGFFPGENLIITTETSSRGLNMEYIDCLIERYLK